MKKIFSLLLIFMLCFNIIGGTAFASSINTYDDNNTKKVKVIKLTENEIIYTYEENGQKYKNIDLISDNQKSVSTQIYQLKDDEYMLVDKISTNIRDDLMIIHSNKTDSYDEIKLSSFEPKVRATKGYSWDYDGYYTGNTKFKNLTIGAISVGIVAALSKSSKVHWTVAVVGTVAVYLYDKSLKTLYFKVYQYVDSSCPLRPAYKEKAYFYEDSDHDKFIEKITRIYDVNE